MVLLVLCSLRPPSLHNLLRKQAKCMCRWVCRLLYFLLLYFCATPCMRNFVGSDGGPRFGESRIPVLPHAPGSNPQPSPNPNPNPCTTAPALNNWHRLGATRRDTAIHTFYFWPHTRYLYISAYMLMPAMSAWLLIRGPPPVDGFCFVSFRFVMFCRCRSVI